MPANSKKKSQRRRSKRCLARALLRAWRRVRLWGRRHWKPVARFLWGFAVECLKVIVAEVILHALGSDSSSRR